MFCAGLHDALPYVAQGTGHELLHTSTSKGIAEVLSFMLKVLQPHGLLFLLSSRPVKVFDMVQTFSRTIQCIGKGCNSNSTMNVYVSSR